MNIYHINSIAKCIIGLTILISSLRFIDPRVDPHTSVIIVSIGLILIVWGVGFYGFLLLMSLFSDKKYSYLASYAYKLSLVAGIFAAVNRLLIGFAIRSWWIGIGLCVVCIFIGAMILDLIKPPAPKIPIDKEK